MPKISNSNPCDILFISELGLWPLDQGFRVHGTQMARTLTQLGVNVAMTSLRPTTDDAPVWLKDMLLDWPHATTQDAERFADGWDGWTRSWRYRVARHQEINPDELAGLVSLVWHRQPKVVIALGQHGPMILRGLSAALPHVKTIWYAADEPVPLQLSCMLRQPVKQWKSHLRLMAIYALIQRLFAGNIYAAIGVNPRDTRLLKYIGSIRHTQTIRNGVDLQKFYPRSVDAVSQPKSASLIFWGRMDFEPNIDAVHWFADKVWLTLRQRNPRATWQIVGKNPTDAVRKLQALPGVTVVGPVADIVPHAHQVTAAILPMRCGAGIKNKLLEAAAMAMPIVASPRASAGRDVAGAAYPWLTSQTPGQWVESVWRLWNDPLLADDIGRQARGWVQRQHTWAGAGEQLLTLANTLLPGDRQIQPSQLGQIDQTHDQKMPTGEKEAPDTWQSKAA